MPFTVIHSWDQNEEGNNDEHQLRKIRKIVTKVGEEKKLKASLYQRERVRSLTHHSGVSDLQTSSVYLPT